MPHFYIPWKQKTGGIGVEHWLKMLNGSVVIRVFCILFEKKKELQKHFRKLKKIFSSKMYGVVMVFNIKRAFHPF